MISGVIFWCGFIDIISDSCRCGKANGEIRESYRSERDVSMGNSGLRDSEIKSGAEDWEDQRENLPNHCLNCMK